MTRTPLLMLAAMLWVAAAGPLAAAGVRIAPATEQTLGIATQRLAPTQRAAEIDAFA